MVQILEFFSATACCSKGCLLNHSSTNTVVMSRIQHSDSQIAETSRRSYTTGKTMVNFRDTFVRRGDADKQTRSKWICLLSYYYFIPIYQQPLVLWIKGEHLCSYGLDAFQVLTGFKIVVFLFEVVCIFSWPPLHFLFLIPSHQLYASLQ